uniref:Uncharacterized protein n=1 Tax=Pristionchus pacificus TaxID=54126 RepID=A0A2A6B9K2_PRIPA|eukprot:PDM62547.1 hypothetical protein PRIPAC_51989 [Pristionchus pacificus]
MGLERPMAEGILCCYFPSLFQHQLRLAPRLIGEFRGLMKLGFILLDFPGIDFGDPDGPD